MIARTRARQQRTETREMGTAAGSAAAGSTPSEPEEVEEQGKKNLTGEVARPPAMRTLEASVPFWTRTRIHAGATCQGHRKHRNAKTSRCQAINALEVHVCRRLGTESYKRQRRGDITLGPLLNHGIMQTHSHHHFIMMTHWGQGAGQSNQDGRVQANAPSATD